MAVLPFETRGLSDQEALQLRERFADALAGSLRFRVVPIATMSDSFQKAGLDRTDTCISQTSLASLGKILNVNKVVLVSVYRWNNRLAMIIRLVGSGDATLLYSERVDYSGELSDLLESIVPEQGRKLAAARLDAGARWDLAVILSIAGLGGIVWIFRMLSRTGCSNQARSSNPPKQTKMML